MYIYICYSVCIYIYYNYIFSIIILYLVDHRLQYLLLSLNRLFTSNKLRRHANSCLVVEPPSLLRDLRFNQLKDALKRTYAIKCLKLEATASNWFSFKCFSHFFRVSLSPKSSQSHKPIVSGLHSPSCGWCESPTYSSANFPSFK